MPILYDSNLTYNSMGTYDFYVAQRMIRRDLYIFRQSDAVFNCQAVDVNNAPIDISNHVLTIIIQEYENGLKYYPASVTKIYPVDGIYQINIDDTTAFDRPRYVYSVYAETGLTKIKLQTGQILVE